VDAYVENERTALREIRARTRQGRNRFDIQRAPNVTGLVQVQGCGICSRIQVIWGSKEEHKSRHTHTTDGTYALMRTRGPSQLTSEICEIDVGILLGL
jgi:hypothetical protein